MPAYELAQLNILDRINALAEDSPGFVWRLQTDEGDAVAIMRRQETAVPRPDATPPAQRA